MWKSPINAIQSEMMMQYEDGVMKAVQRVGFDVNKEELAKALQYDRNQYNKGYADAIEEFAEKCNQKITEFILEHKKQLTFVSGVSVAWNIIDEIAESMKGEK